MAEVVAVAPLVQGNTNLVIDSKTLEQCLKSAVSYGQVTYYNVCTGQQSVVPWGSVEWVFALVLTALGIAVVGFCVIGLIRLALDY